MNKIRSEEEKAPDQALEKTGALDVIMRPTMNRKSFYYAVLNDLYVLMIETPGYLY